MMVGEIFIYFDIARYSFGVDLWLYNDTFTMLFFPFFYFYFRVNITLFPPWRARALPNSHACLLVSAL